MLILEMKNIAWCELLLVTKILMHGSNDVMTISKLPYQNISTMYITLFAWCNQGNTSSLAVAYQITRHSHTCKSQWLEEHAGQD